MIQLSRIFGKYRTNIVVRAGVWSALGTLSRRGLDFATIPLFTQLLTPGQYGTVALFLTWLNLLMSVSTLNVYSAVGRARFDYPPEEFEKFVLATTMLGTIAAGAGLLVLLLVPDSWLLSLTGLDKSLLLLVEIGVVFTLPIYILQQIWQTGFQHKRVMIQNSVLGFGEILAPLALILATPLDHALSRVLGVVIIRIGLGAPRLLRLRAPSAILFNRAYWHYALTYSLPLILHSLSAIALAQIDRVMIAQVYSLEQTGLYTFAYQIGSITYLLWMSINAVWSPWFLGKLSQNQHHLVRQHAIRYAAAFMVITIVLMFVSPPLVRLIAPPEYWEGTRIIGLVLASGFFMLLYSLYVGIENYGKKTTYIAAGTMMAAIINIGLNALLLPISYEAAAWTTLFSYICLFLFHAWIVRVRMPEYMPLFRFWPLLVMGVLVTATAAAMAVML